MKSCFGIFNYIILSHKNISDIFFEFLDIFCKNILASQNHYQNRLTFLFVNNFLAFDQTIHSLADLEVALVGVGGQKHDSHNQRYKDNSGGSEGLQKGLGRHLQHNSDGVSSGIGDNMILMDKTASKRSF
ncbi:hypothetical protein ACJX0J_028866 [Zea mays]